MTPRTAWRRLRRQLRRSQHPPHATYGAIPTNPAGDRLIRCTSIAAVVVVALIAAYISYGHALELVRTHGETGKAAKLAPITVDGMIVASSMVLLQAARYRQPAPWLAYACLWAGIVATGGANAAHGAGHGRVGVLVSVWPAVALIGSYELLMKVIRAGAARLAEPAARQHAPTEDQCPHEVATSAEGAVQVAYLHGRDCLGDKPSQRRLSDQFGVDRKRVAALVHEVDPAARRAKTPQAPDAPDSAMNGSGGR
jgi:Protein of unknown function (DUF2637)